MRKVNLVVTLSRMGSPAEIERTLPHDARFEWSEWEFQGQPAEHTSGVVHFDGIDVERACYLVQLYSGECFTMTEA